MTDQEINIAIAEACGWTKIVITDEAVVGIRPNYPGYPNPAKFPLSNYCNDLNAMHEAVQQFRYPEGGTLWAINQRHLEDIVSRDRNHAKVGVSFQWEVQNATARQRAEALVRTLGKMKD